MACFDKPTTSFHVLQLLGFMEESTFMLFWTSVSRWCFKISNHSLSTGCETIISHRTQDNFLKLSYGTHMELMRRGTPTATPHNAIGFYKGQLSVLHYNEIPKHWSHMGKRPTLSNSFVEELIDACRRVLKSRGPKFGVCEHPFSPWFLHKNHVTNLGLTSQINQGMESKRCLHRRII